jgi:hypothetical protein
VLYVPDSEGEPGAIYVVGINNGSSPYDGRWYGVHQDSEAVLLSVLAEQGAPRLDQYSKQPEVNITPTLKTIMGISVIGLIILVGWVTKRN